MEKIDPRLQLSALWLFVLLNIIFRDLHQFATKPFLEMLLIDSNHGMEIAEELMLLGGVLVQIPIAMVPLSLMLSRRFVRSATFFAAFASAATLLSSTPSNLDDRVHLAFEMVATVAIVWKAWQWPVTRTFKSASVR
ncbi:MAG: DUF6326 family protein [Pseudomonadota bacterium]